MERLSVDYKMEQFTPEELDKFLIANGIRYDGYIYGMTQKSLSIRITVGNVVNFTNTNCFICFTNNDITLVMLSRLSNKHITEIIKINKEEITNTSLTNILFSYMLTLKTNDTTFRIQVLKKLLRFPRVSTDIDLFKSFYIK